MDGVAVCICTYRRPAQLSRLLASLARMACPPSTAFVVVDNDGADPAVRDEVVKFREMSAARVEYVVEPEPGISAARNAALAKARWLGAGAVAMLDDDEWASPGWLTSLMQTRDATGAGVVGGPVRPVFPASRQALRRYERLWTIRQGSLDGRLYVSCTCNCLVDLSAVAFLGDRPFPMEFGLTGGEDAVFFRRLHRAGVPMAWSEEALLFEEISDERASLSWMRRRWYRQGNVGVRCERAAPHGLSPLLKTLLLCARLPPYPLFNRRAFSAPVLWLLESDRVRGRIASHLGLVFKEYGRPVSDRQSAPEAENWR